jgi:APA family basic amino acid/polyamine antiporter
MKFGIWMAIGLAIYGLYGRWHSRLANEDSWDFDIGDTDPGTGGLQPIRHEPDTRPNELRAVRTPPQQQQKPTRGKHMRN